MLVDTATRIDPGFVHNGHKRGPVHAHAGAVESPRRYSVLPGDDGGGDEWADRANVFVQVDDGILGARDAEELLCRMKVLARFWIADCG